MNPFYRGESESFDGVSALRVSFEAAVGSVGAVGIETFLFTEAGTVSSGPESWDVKAGDVKFNVEIPEWNFCNPCGMGAKEVSTQTSFCKPTPTLSFVGFFFTCLTSSPHVTFLDGGVICFYCSFH